MPAITPLQPDVRGLTGRQIEAVDARNVPYNAWGTLLEVTLRPTEDCDLLVIGHVEARQSDGLAREVVVSVRVLLGNTQIGEGDAVTGLGPDTRPSYQSSGILASARDVPAGAHTLRVQGRAWSTTGTPTIRAHHLSVGIVEFYR